MKLTSILKSFMLLFSHMKNRKMVIGLAILVILGVGAFLIISEGMEENAEKLNDKPVVAVPDKSYSLAEVATHKDAKSCWTTIGSNVYDLTPWISAHPGGSQAILFLCGIDGTQAFNDQHGGQGRPERELSSFVIGTLK